MEWAVVILITVLVLAPSQGDDETWNICIGKCDTVEEQSEEKE